MTSAERNPLIPEPGRYWSDLLDDMVSIATALLSIDGSILESNQGFDLLAQDRQDDNQDCVDVWGLFSQPDLRELTSIDAVSSDNPLYSGPFNIDDPQAGALWSLRGSIYRLNEQLLLIVEWDAIELQRSTATCLRRNEELTEKLRSLERHNGELQHLRDELLRQMLTDPLTGIANRRHLDEFLTSELERSRRTRRPLCMVLADLDHFKLINDTHGHTVGDRVLCSFAALLKNKLRSIDLAARYGGEEFVLILPETRLHDAVIVTERIRLALTWLPLPSLPQITASFGVAEWIEGESAEAFLGRADRALYRAKALGRNRVAIDIP